MSGNLLTLIIEDLLPSQATGVARYCGNLLRELRTRDLDFRVRSLAAREVRLGRLSFGYFARILLHRLLVRPSGIVHSLFLYVIPPGTRIMTVWDTFSLPSDYPHPISRWLYRNIRRNLLERPDVYVTISEAVRERLNREFGVPSDRILVAAPGVETDRFRPGAGVRPAAMPVDGRVTILHVGHGYRRKGVHLLVEALGLLEPKEFRLVRVGPQRDPDYIRSYRARAAELGLDLVECGFVPDEVLPSFYSHADLLAFPSLDEGAGIPPLEAMACGTNVVLSDLPAHHEMCGELGFYAPPEAQAFARSIHAALSHPHNAEDLRNFAGTRSWARTADVYMKLYSEFGVVGFP